MQIGKMIRLERVRQDLKGTELACKVGLTRQAISDIENGRCNPSLDTLLKIEDVLKVDNLIEPFIQAKKLQLGIK